MSCKQKPPLLGLGFHKRMNRPTRANCKRLSPPHNKPGRRGKEMRPNPELPQEIIREEILSCLPIISVSRFKSVCKSWRSLFSDPQFVKQHYDRQNPKNNDFLVITKSSHIAIISRYQEKFLLKNDCYDYDLVGSAKGLVCIRRGNVVFLWNPAIYQCNYLPGPLGNCHSVKRMGLGYDPLSNKYKVVICYIQHHTFRPFYDVYSSSTSGSWNLHNQFYDRDVEFVNREYRKYSGTPTTMVRDSPYWTTCSITISLLNKHKVMLCVDALKFDATSNKFKLLPRYSSEFSKDKKFIVVNMRDHLSLMAYELCLEVYSLDEDKGCEGGVWSKMYNFGPFMLFGRFECLQQGFKYGDEIVITESGRITCFNYKLGTFKRIPCVDSLDTCVCFPYTPSLVSLPGMTPIYLEKQTPLLGHLPTILSQL